MIRILFFLARLLNRNWLFPDRYHEVYVDLRDLF